jgi:tetratricopeptide (TPR) repeat protein
MKLKIKVLILIFLSVGGYAQTEAQKSFSEGVRLLKENKYRQAENEFSAAIENGISNENLKMSYIYKGFAQNGQGEYDNAISSFNKAIEIDPLDPSSYIDRALSYTYKKDYNTAIGDYKHVLKLVSTGEQAEGAYYYLGRIMMSTYKYEDAINYFDQLIELNPTDTEAYFLRGTAKSNILDSDGSIADYNKAIELNPNYMEAYANRGVQKINKLPVEQKIGNEMRCFKDLCADLFKAKKLGDDSVEDMIYLYCRNCD